METVLIFFIFLGPLVFFHELGHFFFARLFGVRVEVFSIGFGPKILSFKKGDTQYALSVIPLGGYVKMFGDDPLSEKELTPDEEAVAYTKKGKWARFWIVFGGPVANFILAYFIYTALLFNGERVPQIKFAKISQEHVFHAKGIKTGDVLVKVNDQEIVSFDDLNVIDSQIDRISVARGEKIVEINIGLAGMKFLEEFSKVNSILRAPVVVNPNQELYLLKYPASGIVSLEEILDSSAPTLDVYKLKEDIPIEFQANDFSFDGLTKTTLTLKGTWKETLLENNLYPKDLMVKNVVKDSAAETSKIQKGDLLVGIAGVDIYNFNGLRKGVQALKTEKPVSIKIFNKEGVKEITLTPTFREHNGKKYLSIGVESAVSFYSFMVQTKSAGVFGSFHKAIYRTWDGMVKTTAGFKKLITGEVSIKNVGGPIAIGKVASDSFNISLSMFFRLMAIISINLGIINLFPIPVLDGGHIVLIGFEAANGAPLSRKKLMYAQQVGMSVLLLLIFVAIFNDISRFF